MREGTKVGRTADGVTSLVLGQLSSAWTSDLLSHLEDNSQAPVVTIYLRTYLRAFLHHSGVASALILHWSSMNKFA